MFKNKELEKFEKKFIRKEKINLKKNFKIVAALYQEALVLGIIPPKEPLEGIEVDIKIARVLNSVSKIAEKDSL